jgi:tetratricopeptide (TPR) repeat protein
MARIEAFAHYLKGDFATAEKILQNKVRALPQQDASYNALSQLYVTDSKKLRDAGNTNAASARLNSSLRVIESQIKAQPDNPSAHFNHGNLLMNVNDYQAAANAFTEVLKRRRDNSAALLNRAMCNLQLKKFDEAKRDYLDVLNRFTTTDYRVYYGLAEIAYEQKEWRAARDYYQQYFRYIPANSVESKSIRVKYDEAKKKA